MGILIEVTTDGETTPLQWAALAAFVAVMQGGKPALLSSTAAPVAVPLAPAPVADAAAPSGGNGAGAAPDEGGPIVTPTVLPTITVPPGVDVDSRSLPWDGRIHASTKTQTKAKEWTAKRGVDPDLVKAVEAELFKAMSAPAAAPVIQVEGAPAAPPPPGSGTVIQVEGAPAAPTAPPPPTTTPPIAVEGSPAAAPPPEMAAGETPFTALMRNVVAKQAGGTLTTTVTNEIVASLGLTSIRDLANRPDLIPTFEALLP